MAQRICGHCGVPTHLSLQWYAAPSLPGGERILQGAYTCDNCQNATAATSRHYQGAHPGSTAIADHAFVAGDTTWHPTYAAGRAFDFAPERIAKAADEAYRDASINTRMSAILMARTVIEATAKDKGITTGSLVKKIDDMVSSGLVRQIVADGAHEVRHFGNDMAHGDIEQAITDDDVQEVLELMSVVLQEVFETESRITKLRSRRASV